MKKLQLEHYLLIGLFGFLLAIAITTDYHRAVDYLFSDEAVYYMMAQSLAFDYDIEYTPQDLQRMYEDGWYAGPQGIYLTKVANGRIYYSKYWAYSLFLAPFVRLFGLKGFLILNVLLLIAMIRMGWTYLRQFNLQNSSFLIAATFYLLSASFIYTFWITPEVFHMFCITLGLFLWLYRREDRLPDESSYRRMLALEETRHDDWRHARSRVKRILAPVVWLCMQSITFLKWLFTTPNGRLFLAPIPIGIAYASKITNLLFMGPILADVLLTGYIKIRESRASQKFSAHTVLRLAGKLVALGLVFWIVAQILFSVQYTLTGHSNPYAGDRKMFIWDFPFTSSADSWEKGARQTNDDYWKDSFFLTPKTFFYSIYYYVFGRFTGMLPYFICAVLAVYYFLRSVFSRRISPVQTLKLWRRVSLLFFIIGHIGAYIILATINYHGGSGAFGNRFFLNIYPAFVFLITVIPNSGKGRRIPVPVSLLVTWILGSLFLAQAILNPFQTSYYPAAHAFKFPYRFLPVELTMINSIPTHVNPHLMQAVDDEDPRYRLYFFDENVADLTSREFWVKGERTLEFAMLTYEPQSHLVVTVMNGPVADQVDVSIAGRTQSVTFTAPGERKRLVFPLNWSMPYFKSSVYPGKIRSHTGFVPKFNNIMDLKGLDYLGCRVSFSFDLLEAGKIYLEQGRPQEAVRVLESEVQEHPDDIHLRYYLGKAYLETGNIEAALTELEQCERLLPEYQEEEFFTKTYEAEDLLRKTGTVLMAPEASKEKVVTYDPDADRPGFLVYGPYEEFPAGQYRVTYHLKIDHPYNPQGPSIGTTLFFDVSSPKYGIFLKRDSVVAEAGEDGLPDAFTDYTLDVDLVYPTSLEFRVETTGYAEVTVDKIEIAPRLPAQLIHALAQVKNATGEYEGAYQYMQQALQHNPTNVAFQREFLQILLNLERWDEVEALLKRNGGFSSTHTGLLTYVDPAFFPDADSLPDSLVQLWDEVYAGFVPEHLLSHTFEDKLALIGYGLDKDILVRGESFSITYYWQSLAEMDEDYTIFVHFTKQRRWLDPETVTNLKRKLGRAITDLFQQDHRPLYGAYPTTKWLPCELIREQYEVTVPSDIEPGVYDIWIGVWNPFTQTRLTIDGKDTKVKIAQIRID